jgi:hypothetical protein
MKLYPLLSSLALLLVQTPLTAEPFSLASKSQPSQIVVNNRILADVNGKTITVVDLMKKMDIHFYREFPQYASMPFVRHEFYEANWRHVLDELIDKELIIADAEEAKVPLSPGDVRQEMERLFGPNIIANLDKIGMSFDEAQKIVQGDLLIQRALYVRVNSKAMRKVTPLDVRNYYEEYIKTNERPAQWVYQVITIRDKDPSVGAAIANLAYDNVVNDSVPLENLVSKIKESSAMGKNTQVTVSEELKHKENEISPLYKESLQKLTTGSYSQPITQKSRSDKSTVFRFFFLKEFIPGGPPPFAEVEGELKGKLLENAIIAESTAYLTRLRRHFDVQETVPEDFKPFSLK